MADSGNGSDISTNKCLTSNSDSVGDDSSSKARIATCNDAMSGKVDSWQEIKSKKVSENGTPEELRPNHQIQHRASLSPLSTL